MDYALNMLREQRESASKDNAAAIVARVKALHVDEMPTGTKVSFVKRFSGQREYTYLALKVRDEKLDVDLWYVTGQAGGLGNERFEELLAEKLGFESFRLLVPVPKPADGGLWVLPSYHAVGPEMDGEEDPA